MRELHVNYTYQGNTRVPCIKLTGHWLEKLGLDVGTAYEIKQEEGRIIICKKSDSHI